MSIKKFVIGLAFDDDGTIELHIEEGVSEEAVQAAFLKEVFGKDETICAEIDNNLRVFLEDQGVCITVELLSDLDK